MQKAPVTVPASVLKLRKELRQPAKGTVTSATLLAAFLWIVWFAAPERLPAPVHHLFALVNATLALLTVLFAAAELPVLRSGAAPASDRRFGWGEVCGAILFALVLAWWFSAWAPIRSGAF